LPFYLSKRAEDPTPSSGEVHSLDLFKELTGLDYNTIENVKID